MRTICTSAVRISGSLVTIAKLLPYGLSVRSCGAGRGRLGALENCSLIALATAAGSASATTSNVAFEAQYQWP